MLKIINDQKCCIDLTITHGICQLSMSTQSDMQYFITPLYRMILSQNMHFKATTVTANWMRSSTKKNGLGNLPIVIYKPNDY